MANAFVFPRAIVSFGFVTLAAACSSVTIPGIPGNQINPPANTLPTAPRPDPDARGVITYPGYQVAIARPGETLESLSERLGLSAPQVAITNGLPAGEQFTGGEVVLIPGDGSTIPAETSIASTAGAALNRAESSSSATSSGSATASAPAPSGQQPLRHTVQRGESAYSIARLYNVSARSLADWNGLDETLAVREGQVLLIPVATSGAAAASATSAPGEGSPSPQPPSSTSAQPSEDLQSVAAASAAGATPPAAALNDQRTAVSDTTKLLTPVSGRIIRGYDPRRQQEGLDFSAAAGAQVVAADEGTVAAITRDVDQVPIIVLRHSDNLLTVYANVDNIKVEKGARVRRGQQIAEVRAGEPPFLHFEVRKGLDSVDPVPYLTE
ncbi:MAG: M23 family metallopeptidase [Mangrovicoccus sp.]|nr:M23 family metallopeptidase [Mangrovicoccus sp.]